MGKCECGGTGLIWLEDEEEWVSCSNGCQELEEEDEDVKKDELLDNKELFPDELPEENKKRWEDS